MNILDLNAFDIMELNENADTVSEQLKEQNQLLIFPTPFDTLRCMGVVNKELLVDDNSTFSVYTDLDGSVDVFDDNDDCPYYDTLATIAIGYSEDYTKKILYTGELPVDNIVLTSNDGESIFCHSVVINTQDYS